ncbi:hypothetical protein AB0M36_18055 [Actinoplanes sp. NPDC051346]|uniref:hypothetical protein n=1 Tax=Actinoplanes sp. NPDC051346 TaxID=3155048 RepID=UPI00344435C2
MEVRIPIELDSDTEQTRLQVTVGRTPYRPVFEVSAGTETTDVVMTFDLTPLADTVVVTAAQPGCSRAGAVITCDLGDPQAGERPGMRRQPLALTAAPGAAPGPAGSFTFAASGVSETGGYNGGPASSGPVRVLPRGTDLKVIGDRQGHLVLPVPSKKDDGFFKLRVENAADELGHGAKLAFKVPRGLELKIQRDILPCVDEADEIICTLPDIQPGSMWTTADKNSSGQIVEVFAKAGTPGPATYAIGVRVITSKPDLNEKDNTYSQKVETKGNTIDVAMTAKVVRDGDSATLTWMVANRGPSDATGRTVVINAPVGTELEPAAGCTATGTTKLTCVSAEWLPAGKSVSGDVRLRITGSAGADGTVTVSGTGPSTETKPADNTAAIDLTGEGAGSGADDDGPELPITGSSTVLVGAGVLLVGAVLVLIGGRRRRS